MKNDLKQIKKALFKRAVGYQNRRAKRVWKVLAFIIGGIIVMYILGIIAFTTFTTHPTLSGTEETPQVVVGTETDN